MPEQKTQSKKPKLRFHKLRLWMAWIGGAFLFITSHSTDEGFRLGVPIVLAGMLVRVLATGFIERKNQRLATAGPFAYVRNPLYVGNFLIGLGFVAIVQNWVTAIIFLVGFVVLYRGTVLKEEGELASRFGESYQAYMRAVPRFFPRLTPYPGSEKVPFQWKLLLKHREIETLLAILLLITGLYLWEELIIEQGGFAWKEKIAAAIGLALIVGLFIEKAFRDRQKALFPN